MCTWALSSTRSVWVCGTFEEDLSWTDPIPPGQIVSHVSHTWTYGTTCGAQADNYDTYLYTPTTAGRWWQSSPPSESSSWPPALSPTTHLRRSE